MENNRFLISSIEQVPQIGTTVIHQILTSPISHPVVNSVFNLLLTKVRVTTTSKREKIAVTIFIETLKSGYSEDNLLGLGGKIMI